MDMLPQWNLGYNETIANFNDGLNQLGLVAICIKNDEFHLK